MKIFSMFYLSILFIYFMVPIQLLANEQATALLKLKKEAEELIGNISKYPNLFKSAKYDLNDYMEASASIYLIGRLGLSNYTYNLENICSVLENDPFLKQGLALEIWAALARLGNKKYIDKTIKYALSQKGIEQIEAAHVLLDIAPKEALKILKNYVYGIGINEITSAVEVLAQLKDPLAYEYLSQGLSYEDEEIQFQCAMTLTRGKWIDGIELLKHSFKYGEEERRIRAAIGLSRLGDDDAIKFMISLLNSDSSKYQWLATVSLGSSSKEIARIPLEKYANDDKIKRDVRASALRALGNIGNPKSILIINRLTSSKDKIISIASAGAIIQIIDKIKIEMISPYLLVAW